MTIRTIAVRLTTVFLFFIWMFSAMGQTPNRTRIAVTDKKKQPIGFATITIKSQSDSAQKFTQTADSAGIAYFTLTSDHLYWVSISAVDYLPLEKGVVVKQTGLQFEMEANSKMLTGVVITAKKPLMRQEEDKTIVDPENLVASSTNAYEVLEKTPGLFIDQDGNIYLASTTPATIYINGREMKMSAADVATMLKNLPPASIARLEVMRTPSAKYDASGGGGIVNVVLKKGVKIGLTGSVNMGVNQGVYGSQFAGFTINNNNDGVNSYLNISAGRRGNYEQIATTRQFAPDSVLSQDAYTRYPANYFYGGYGINKQVNKKWELGYDGRLSLSAANNNTDNQSTIRKQSTGSTLTNNLAAIDNNSRSLALNQGFNSKYKMDTIGSEWTVDLSYSYNQNRNDQVFATNFFLPIIPTVGGDGQANNNRHLLLLQTDLKWKFPRAFSIETGAKMSLLGFRNATEYFKESNGVRTKDVVRTNTFRYTENINAAYLQASKTVSGIVFKAGVRLENTNMKGRQLVPADTSFNIHRTDFFPYLYINRKLFSIASYPLTAYLVFRRTISRPSYEYLNPFQRFVDAYLTETGNPALRPQFTNNVEANVSAGDVPVLAIGYNHTKDIFSSVVYQAEGNRSTALRTYDNLGTNKEVYFRALGAIPPGGKYFFVLGAQYNHNFYQGVYENKPLSFKRGSWSFFTYQTLKLGSRSMFSINGFIRLKGQQQFYELGGFGGLSANINRQFFKRKLTVTLSMNDIFFTNNNTFTIQQGTVSAFGYRQADTRRLGINLRYNFGIRKKEDNDNNAITTESPEKGN